MRLKQYEAIPPFRWFTCGTFDYDNGEEYWFAILKLPSWQWMECFWTLQYCWHQLAIRFHGKHGFSMAWLPLTEGAARDG